MGIPRGRPKRGSNRALSTDRKTQNSFPGTIVFDKLSQRGEESFTARTWYHALRYVEILVGFTDWHRAAVKRRGGVLGKTS